MFERFTKRARNVLALANQQAQLLDHEYIGTEHILLGLVEEGSGVGVRVLMNMKIRLDDVTDGVRRRLNNCPTDQFQWQDSQSWCGKNALLFATSEAEALGHNYVGTEHLLLGLLREKGGVASSVLSGVGASLDEARKTTIELLGPEN